MGILKFLHDKADEVLSGTYYQRKPKTTADVGIKFNYSVINATDKSYAKLLDNIHANLSVCTIKTDDQSVGILIGHDKDKGTNGYICTQDGKFWQVQGIISSGANENTLQALRRYVRTVQSNFIIRLIGVDNPMDLK